MGSSFGEFVKYPRTPHLFGSRGTTDDKHLSESESLQLIADESLIVEEKLDGTNVGIHFSEPGKLVLQCRGHLITEGMHPQYDLFKQWAAAKQHCLEQRLSTRYILFGEWLYARHSIHYLKLPHYLFEFDIYDKELEVFIGWEARQAIIAGTGIVTVPVLHRGTIDRSQLPELLVESKYGSRFENPLNKRVDHLIEGLYVRTEAEGVVTARAKFVRPEFVEKIKQSTHWQHQQMVPNQLADGVDIWS